MGLPQLRQVDAGGFVKRLGGFLGGDAVFGAVAALSRQQGLLKQVFVDDYRPEIGDGLFVVVHHGAFLVVIFFLFAV